MIFSEKVIFSIIFITLTLTKANNAANSDNKQDAKCLLPMEPGPCRMNLERFYYNAKTDTCEKFKFGGCKGNDNKFGFQKTCEDACKKSTGTATKAAASTADKSQFKSDTNAPVSSTTTVKPVVARTTVKTPRSTPTKSVITTTQKPKPL